MSDGVPSKEDLSTIIAIINKIAKYPPAVLDVSGGDPLLLDGGLHEYLKQELPATRRQIIVNPKSFYTFSTKYQLEKVNQHYDQVGISINTEDEIKAFNEIKNEIKIPITIITNFSLLNLYLVDSIASVVGSLKPQKVYWQVQFTMLTDNTTTLYDKPQAIALLNTSLGKYTNIIVADNANNASCLAGINSMGILHNGLVVPCLSMRSWCDTLTDEVQGNLLEESLKDIWTTRFQKNRFEAVKCCKDFCKHAKITPAPMVNPILGISLEPAEYKNERFDLGVEIMRQIQKQPIKSPNVTVYGCFNEVTPIYSVYFEGGDDNSIT
jgi:MoaA/NifB/PqqE/SkfB family radical SAM enzyme